MLLYFVAGLLAIIVLGFVCFIGIATLADRKYEQGRISRLRHDRITNVAVAAYMALLVAVVLIGAIFGPDIAR